MEKDKPTEARIVELLLQSAGIHDCDAQVVPMLLEFAHRYTTEILSASQMYADHANHLELTPDDIKLAVAAKVSHSFTTPPSKDVLFF